MKMTDQLKNMIRDEVTRNAEAYLRDYLDSAIIGFIEDEVKKVLSEVMGDCIRSIIVDYLKEKAEKKVVSFRTIVE
jgi:hypothetical protein